MSDLTRHTWIIWSSKERAEMQIAQKECHGRENTSVGLEKIPPVFITTGTAYCTCRRGNEQEPGTSKKEHSSYNSLLQTCIKEKKVSKAKWVHCHIAKGASELDIFLSNMVLNMYAKCGCLSTAYQVFYSMTKTNVFTWTTMISGCLVHEEFRAAFELFQQMQFEGIRPDEVTFICTLNACAQIASLAICRYVHAHVTSQCTTSLFLGNTLVDTYAKCMSMEDSEHVFNAMYARDVVSWNALLTGYSLNGNHEEVLKRYIQLKFEGTKPDVVTFVCAITSCGEIAAQVKGKWVHCNLLHCGFKSDDFVLCALISMYFKCGCIDFARRQLFDIIDTRNVVLWNVMIAGHAYHRNEREVIYLFQQMQQQNMKPDKVTLLSVLGICSNPELGKKLHAYIVKTVNDMDPFVASALVNMYAECGNISDARQVFDNAWVGDVVLWSLMIAGYMEQGSHEEGLKLFNKMREQGLEPDKITLVSILNAYANLIAVEEGKWLHLYIIKSGYVLDNFLNSALMDMYSKCHNLDHARQVFNTICGKDLVCWNTMITCYVQHGYGQDALKLYIEMQRQGVKPGKVTYLCVLSACAITITLKLGKEVHSELMGKGHGDDVFLGSALIDMYVKCGSIIAGRQIFDKILIRDLAVWNAMIGGYAQQGDGLEAIRLFKQMVREGVKPNQATFNGALYACSHRGLVVYGCHHFVSMHSIYGVTAVEDHYACMVNVFGRAGLIDVAEDLLHAFPLLLVKTEAWMSLLSACRIYNIIKQAENVVSHLCNLDQAGAAAFVILANIYAMNAKG